MYLSQIKNPKTKRYITIGSYIYNNLLKEYDESELLKSKKSKHKELEINTIIDSTYIVVKKIGQGGSGCVYKAKNINNDEFVVIKSQRENVKNYLKIEYDFYTKIKNIDGFPKLYHYYTDCECIYKSHVYTGHFLVMELLGKSLSDYYHRYGLFSLKNTLLCGLQLLDRIQKLHQLDILHYDIKPGNCVIHENKIYLLDFGLSMYVSEVAHSNNTFRGTRTYASCNVHKGITYSYRDDLESLVYVLTRIYTGDLPWDKIATKLETLKLKKKFECPGEFIKFYNYVMILKFNELPNYELLKLYLINCAEKNNIILDHINF